MFFWALKKKSLINSNYNQFFYCFKNINIIFVFIYSKFLKSSERQQCDIARMMTYSQEMIPPLSNPPFLFLNHLPMSAQEIPRIKETFNSERESDNLFDNTKFLETPNKDFQTKKISEFAKNSARKRGVTLIEQPSWRKDSTGSSGKKKSKMGLLGLLFKRNQLKSLGTNPEVDGIQGEMDPEKVQRKNSDTSVDIKGERSQGSNEMVKKKISFSNEDFEDMFSDDNQQSDNGSESSGESIKIKTNLIYLTEGTQEKTRPSIEAKELFADEIIEERTPLILKNSPELATLNPEKTSPNLRDITPRSAINLDRPPNLKLKEFKHQRNGSNTFQISKIQEEKKEIIKKDKAIKACIMLEENLRQVNETKFSIKSLRILEVSLQLLKDVNLTLNQKEGYEHDKVMELLDFVNKIIEIGTHYLKYRSTKRNFVHNEIVKKSERSSNLIRMSSSLGSMERWSKEDFQQKSPETEDKEKEVKDMFLIETNNSPKDQINDSKRVFLEDRGHSIQFEKTFFGHSQDFIPKERIKRKDFVRFSLLPNKKGGGRRKLHVLHHREIYEKKIIKKPSFQIGLLEEDALIKKLNKLKKPERSDMQHSVIIKRTPNKYFYIYLMSF